MNHGITYHRNLAEPAQGYSVRNKLIAAVDSNYYHNGDKATSGSVILLNGGAVAWRSSRQATVTTSSTHAEVTAAAEFATTVQWARDFMECLGLKQPTTRVIVDNKAVCDQAVSGKELRKAEHYKAKQVYIEQCVRDGDQWFDHTKGDDNPSDIMTKATAVQVQRRHADNIMGRCPSIPISEGCKKIIGLGWTRYVKGGHAQD